MQDDHNIYDYGSLEETLQLLQDKKIKFVGICQDGCDPVQMEMLVSTQLHPSDLFDTSVR